MNEQNQQMGQQTPNQQSGQQTPPPYIPPKKINFDSEETKKRKRDAVNALGDKVADVLKADPILAFLEKNAELFSYIATGVCALFSILLLPVGGFWIVPIILSLFALSKKKLLPLTVSMSALTFFDLVGLLRSIGSIFSRQSNAFVRLVSIGTLFDFFISLVEFAAIGFLTYIVWTYFLALQPTKSAPPQQPQQPVQPVQPAQPTQTTQPAQPAQPVLTPINSDNSAGSDAASGQNTPSSANMAGTDKKCSVCGAENTPEALFCKQCGNRF